MAAAGSVGMVVTPGAAPPPSPACGGPSDHPFRPAPWCKIADSSGTVVAAFLTAKATASLVFSSAGITESEEYTAYTGGTATVSAGLGEAPSTAPTKWAP